MIFKMIDRLSNVKLREKDRQIALELRKQFKSGKKKVAKKVDNLKFKEIGDKLRKK